ncbi:peroxiredoxin [Thermogymnomonas acidicola]|uniref:thioredoxin-dependent peroxiredoxin n=1 Tax=Thermogymnomonas acidicola TaxID=399579 RepID=A0AA37BRB4_9ARCH|nr:peroxiredoxin [Thermogymnomonas acidicola]GGM71222.1 peroxiredoxin [Thermogymnomonas acidicola]
MELLQVGAQAPDFEFTDTDGKRKRLSDLRGRPVVVYFYPKDNTPGCTTEACGFRDSMQAYESRGVKVIGISVDSEESHRKFREKFGLNFPLVPDPEKRIVSAYGVLGDRSAKRITYIIGPDGKVAYVYGKVSPKDHPAEVLEKLRELGFAT